MNMLKKFWIITISQNKLLLLSCLLVTSSTFAFTEPVFSGAKKLVISKSLSLQIKSFIEKGCDLGRDLCLPSSQLLLNDSGYKYDLSKLIKYWNNSSYVYFVYLKDKKYFSDLDGDGSLEVALYPMVAGNNPITDTYIYSIKGNRLSFYGMGRFHFEWGPFVKQVAKGKWIEPKI